MGIAPPRDGQRFPMGRTAPVPTVGAVENIERSAAVDGNVGTIVIGAGQAGLAMSRCLRDRGLPHLVLERGRVGQRWRSERWDSFTLLSPNWQTRLRGTDKITYDPDGWTIRSADCSRTAHSEHTIAITDGQPIVLTSADPDPIAA